jgi:hypothetical protein
MRTLSAILAAIFVGTLGACVAPSGGTDYRDISGAHRTDDQLHMAYAKCDYEQTFIPNPGPYSHDRCMMAQGFQRVR